MAANITDLKLILPRHHSDLHQGQYTFFWIKRACDSWLRKLTTVRKLSLEIYGLIGNNWVGVIHQHMLGTKADLASKLGIEGTYKSKGLEGVGMQSVVDYTFIWEASLGA
jgi:hypothetical protein